MLMKVIVLMFTLLAVPNELEYHFTSNDGRGISNFMRLSQLHDPAKEYLVNYTCVIRVEVTCKMDEGGVSSQPTISQQRPGKTFSVVCTRGMQTRFQNISPAKSRKKGSSS
ncbi:hypothetical protein C5167_001974 [Papaver somniferum]|uniref:MATH domain-containing protein n=1 Tax=Papaver somniferum TaxID=3469 RepID=A0A4Y7KT61_PAPSO|nr:hypothetical protein C5167_001974 [Papaver somniferum]